MASVLENLGKFIAEKRKDHRDLSTQEALAASVGITRATLIKIESGETTSSFDLISKILKSLGTTFSEFEKFNELQSVENKILSQIRNSSDREKILRRVQELSDANV